ncbi:MAG: hypothetical protein L0387_39220 [Acidobacteria bacterium]|nr:hypothetical protein [Acidobacteriota bacterium]
MTRLRLVVAFLLLSAGAEEVFGQTRLLPSVLSPQQFFPQTILDQIRNPTPTAPVVEEDRDVADAHRNYLLALYKRNIEIIQERRQVICITNGIGYVICFVAHVILGIALWSAVREFNAASKRRKKADEAPTELQVSLEGVALKTSLHGTILLVLALVFYFMYLQFVYKVVEVDGTGQAAVAMTTGIPTLKGASELSPRPQQPSVTPKPADPTPGPTDPAPTKPTPETAPTLPFRPDQQKD